MSETKLQDWQLIDWKYVEGDVRNLSQQIFVASKNAQNCLSESAMKVARSALRGGCPS